MSESKVRRDIYNDMENRVRKLENPDLAVAVWDLICGLEEKDLFSRVVLMEVHRRLECQ